MTTGQRIKKARIEAHMTQDELAAKLNIPYQSISQWERNLRNPKKENIKRIAEALGASITMFYDFSPEEQSIITRFECALSDMEKKICAAKQENAPEAEIEALEKKYELMVTTTEEVLDNYIQSANVRNQIELAVLQAEAILRHEKSASVKQQEETDTEYETARTLLKTTFEQLNYEGQQKFLAYMRELSSLLVQIPNYQRKK